MASRRDPGTRGLLQRIRWGNVARLAAIVAAGAAIAAGPRACGGGGPELTPLPGEVDAGPTGPAPEGPTPGFQADEPGPAPAATSPKRVRKRHRRHRHRR